MENVAITEDHGVPEAAKTNVSAAQSQVEASTQAPAPEVEIDAPCADSADDATPPKEDDRATHFDFQNRVFKIPGARFCLREADKQPVFCFDMGGMEATLEIKALEKEFGISGDARDEDLVAKAVKGLRYVPDIRPGDKIPSEILDGTASWRINARHRKIAVQRLKAQLISWVSGQEILITDPDELEMYFGQIENKEKVKKAFSDAAEMLGHKRDDHAGVFEKIDTLGRELCYIEALRDRYNVVPMILKRIDDMSDRWKTDRRQMSEVQRIKLLFKSGIQEYSKIFDEIDAQTGEVISALKTIGRQVDYIRKVRDDLHFLMMAWDPIVAKWNEVSPTQGYQVKLVMADTYRFLAGRYNTAQSMLQ